MDIESAMIRVFVSAKGATPHDHQLIAVGLAASTGQTLYLELPFDEDNCDSATLNLIVPALEKSKTAVCGQSELQHRIFSWLDAIRCQTGTVELCFQSHFSWWRFMFAIDYQMPAWCQCRRFDQTFAFIDEVMLADFFVRSGLNRHHAGHEAEALRYACPDAMIRSHDGMLDALSAGHWDDQKALTHYAGHLGDRHIRRHQENSPGHKREHLRVEYA